ADRAVAPDPRAPHPLRAGGLGGGAGRGLAVERLAAGPPAGRRPAKEHPLEPPPPPPGGLRDRGGRRPRAPPRARGRSPPGAGGQAFRAVPGANHFVARVLFDCVLAVSQSLFTIALFLFYWRKQEIPAPAVLA